MGVGMVSAGTSGVAGAAAAGSGVEEQLPSSSIPDSRRKWVRTFILVYVVSGVGFSNIVDPDGIAIQPRKTAGIKCMIHGKFRCDFRCGQQ
jgi:hypothetical protein